MDNKQNELTETEKGWIAKNPLNAWRHTTAAIDGVALPLRDAAEQIGTTYSSVWYWEKGDFLPKHEKMQRIAQLLKIEVSDLYTAWQTWLDSKPITEGVVV